MRGLEAMADNSNMVSVMLTDNTVLMKGAKCEEYIEYIPGIVD